MAKVVSLLVLRPLAAGLSDTSRASLYVGHWDSPPRRVPTPTVCPLTPKTLEACLSFYNLDFLIFCPG